MRLVIDIPDKDYEFVRDIFVISGGRMSYKSVQANVINAIKQGTPYNTERPQGEWIIADKVLDYYHECPFCHWRNDVTAHLENFCPNCGADMRGKE